MTYGHANLLATAGPCSTPDCPRHAGAVLDNGARVCARCALEDLATPPPESASIPTIC